jgi:hypothetical protein
MSPDDRRKERRLDIDIGATLVDGDTTIPCRLLNMCIKGFLIEADTRLPVGYAVSLVVPLYARETVRCTVQIKHVNAQRLGALITEINSRDQWLCSRFLRETRLARAAHAVALALAARAA